MLPDGRNIASVGKFEFAFRTRDAEKVTEILSLPEAQQFAAMSAAGFELIDEDGASY